MRFHATIEPYPGRPEWRCIWVPAAAPPTHPWGRTPVVARLDTEQWETSTWSQKAGGTLLMLPPALRDHFALGQVVDVELLPRMLDPAHPRRRRR